MSGAATTTSTAALARRSAGPARHVYDVIVVGGHLAGSLTTVLLARRGLQVLHVPHDGLAGRYTHKDHTFPHTPFLLPAVSTLPALGEVLDEVGVGLAVSRSLSQPALQVLTPGNWYELKTDEKARALELKRALRTGADALELELKKAVERSTAADAFVAARPDFPPEGFFARWRFRRQLAKFEGLDVGTSLSSGSFVRALLPFVAPVEAPVALTQNRLLGRLSGGDLTPGDGLEGLQTSLAERARELGADVLEPHEGVLSLEPGSTPGVRLRKGDTVYRCGFLVGATDVEALNLLMPEGKQGALKKLPPLAPTRAIFTLHAVVPETALPRGLGTLAIVLPDGGSPVLLEVRQASGADQSMRQLSLSTVAPAALRGNDSAIKSFIDGLWASVDFVLPFTRAHAKLESTPWLHDEVSRDARAGLGPLYPLPPDSWVGLTALATASPWKRTLLANRQIYPGLGIEGEALAALRAVARIEKALKKNDPLKKRTA